VSKMQNCGRGRGAAIRAAAGLAVVSAGLGGCADSFMDPSVVGRWEATPAVMPILDRIASIEDDSGQMVETSDPLEADLLPLPQAYRIGPGDQLEVTVYDLIETGQPERYDVVVDPRGAIELPQLGRLTVTGLTTEEATEVIRNAMKRLVAEPLASVVARGQRQQTYNIIGDVQSPGPYFIPRADYRLLEAITAGGRFDENVQEIYVIRQVPLTDDVTGRQPTATPAQPVQPQDGSNLIDVIDQIAPPADPAPAPQTPPGEPGTQPTTPEAPPPAVPLPGEPTPAPRAEQPEPMVDLPENQPAATTPQAPEQLPAPEGEGSWIFVNGKWVQSSRAARSPSTPAAQGENLITQRVIRIPMRELIQGKQSVNIIIRPGDVIRVPAPPSGLFYVGGQVARPGVYQLPASGGVTLTRAIIGAGGYGNIAIPERTELTRIVAHNREATILLDGKAIGQKTQPDMWLKPNDVINVGTNWWALPVAVIRNGFRASYGFGFVLDRNISNDLFGPPPVNAFGQ
jgi:polysaccharide export outer membrane protein